MIDVFTRPKRLDAGDALIAILRGLSFDLDAQAAAAQPPPDREICAACGCLCHPDEVCPSCRSRRSTP